MLNSFEFESDFYLVFEYSDMGDLFNYIDEKYDQIAERVMYIRDLFTQIKPSIVKAIIKDMCTALVCCHRRNICHKDIKPENILLFKNKGELAKTKPIIFKLGDLGLAQCSLEKIKSRSGTPAYNAPELHKYEEHYCDKTDMWSIGILTYLLSSHETHNAFEHIEHYKNENEIEERVKANVIDVQTRSFIIGLLKMNPSERMTAEECLNHSFLKN